MIKDTYILANAAEGKVKTELAKVKSIIEKNIKGIEKALLALPVQIPTLRIDYKDSVVEITVYKDG